METSSSIPINFKSTSDGWRGKLADNFNFQNIGLLGEAISKYIYFDLETDDIVIGYDTRFMSHEFAKYLADIFTNHGINVFLLSKPYPTPFLTFTTLNLNAKIGLTVTASHNPPFDNGVKIRMGYGGVPSSVITENIEKYFNKKDRDIINANKGIITLVNPIEDYIKKIKKTIGNQNPSKKLVSVVVDTMHGTSLGLLKKIVKGTNINVSYINSSFDPYFGQFPPEPKFETTTRLQELVVNKKYDLGIAHDGDGDRITAVSQKHGYLSPHDVSALILWYLVSIKKMSGKVIGSSTLGRRVRLLCHHFGLVFQEIPVGFKNATEIMLKEQVLMACEENGGIGFGFYLPERDATLTAAILCEIESSIIDGVDFALDEIEKIAGKSSFSRFNYVPNINRNELMSRIKNVDENSFSFFPVNNISRLDGIKVIFTNNDWVSIRFSGTEDIIRIYAESDNRIKAEKIIKFIKELFIKLEK